MGQAMTAKRAPRTPEETLRYRAARRSKVNDMKLTPIDLTTEVEQRRYTTLLTAYFSLPIKYERLERAVAAVIGGGGAGVLDEPYLLAWGRRGVVFPGRPELAQPLDDLAQQVEHGNVNIPEAGLRHAPGALMLRTIRAMESLDPEVLAQLLKDDPTRFTSVLQAITRMVEVAKDMVDREAFVDMKHLTQEKAGELLLDILHRYPKLGQTVLQLVKEQAKP